MTISILTHLRFIDFKRSPSTFLLNFMVVVSIVAMFKISTFYPKIRITTFKYALPNDRKGHCYWYKTYHFYSQQLVSLHWISNVTCRALFMTFWRRLFDNLVKNKCLKTRNGETKSAYKCQIRWKTWFRLY